MKTYHFVLLSLILAFSFAGCSSEPEEIEIEVTRIVEQEIEVTRIVEIEVTRIVTPTPLPGGVYGSPECDEYIDSVNDLFSRWADAFDVASSTARASLSDRVVDMQEIRREMTALDEPECATQIAVQSRLVQMMEDGIAIFTEFMAQNDVNVETASYSVSLDLAADALGALRAGESETPRRIHYWAFGETGFSLDYIDETGEFQIADPGDFTGRFGFDQQPVVFSALIPESERAAVRLYNPTEGNKELTCAIFVNGEEVILNSGTIDVVCETE